MLTMIRIALGGLSVTIRHSSEQPELPGAPLSVELGRPGLVKCSPVPATAVVVEDNVVPLRARRTA